jgi:glycosyltransferase involved in cell wall biosynthesis
MKVSIGTNIKEGPWGGGNLFAINLSNYLKSKGHEVFNDLSSNDIDLILLTEPRKTSESSAFTHIDVSNYLKYIKKDTLVVHRINECDERKNTNFVNDYLITANKVADYTVFVSTWLELLFSKQGIGQKKKKVILSGANKNIFNNKNYKIWDGAEKIKIVTHHWGANWNKGFEIYEKLDKLLGEDNWRKKVEFTYIGNLPENFEFKNSKTIKPLSGIELAEKIKENHIYITASINEPSGNHHIEAAQCGIPLLYIDSGGIPEYCNDFGVKFKKENFIEKLKEIIENYHTYQRKMTDYPFTSDAMCEEYENLFIKMYKDKEDITKNKLNDYEIFTTSYFSFEFTKKRKKLKKIVQRYL